MHDYFSNYNSSKERLFRCAIFIGFARDQVPQRMEPHKNDEWETVHYNHLKSMKLTYSLVEKSEDIRKAMVNYRIKKSKISDMDMEEKARKDNGVIESKKRKFNSEIKEE